MTNDGLSRVPGAPERIVIVGGGLAAGRAISRLCDLGWGGRLTVVTDEPHAPYEKPPLSKNLLLDAAAPAETTYIKPLAWYADHGVDLRTATRATSLDLAGSAVEASEGREPAPAGQPRPLRPARPPPSFRPRSA